MWYYDLEVGEDVGQIAFKIRRGDDWWRDPGDDYRVYPGLAFATWDPWEPTLGDTLTITYDAADGPLEAVDTVYVHIGFDEGWDEAASHAMTSVGGTVWEYTVEIPEEYNTSVNFVFNNGYPTADPVIWHSEGHPTGRAWRAFLWDAEE